ncbi:MAG: ankyrin repeat domain-containing protein [Gammaproteobacteria bacterium]|nr:ankyrin repeat domain-containing protein [Gammaproteobacteria bacterium]
MKPYAFTLCCLPTLLAAGSLAGNAGATTPAVALAAAPAPVPANGPLETSLLSAATKGDVPALADLLARGARIDAVDPADGQTALLKAIGNGDIAATRLLIERGANLEVVNAIGYTPLQFAAGLEYTALAKLLVDRGANVNSRAGRLPALIHATRTSNLELVDYLLAKGADPNQAASDGSTALIWACGPGAGHIAVVESLLSHGAKVDAVAADGRTALSEAVANGYADVAEDLRAAGARGASTPAASSAPPPPMAPAPVAPSPPIAPPVGSQCMQDLEKKQGLIERNSESITYYARQQRSYADAHNPRMVCFYWKMAVETSEATASIFREMGDLASRCPELGSEQSKIIAQVNGSYIRLSGAAASARDEIRETCAGYP